MSAIVKELLKSDSIGENYAQTKKGPVFDLQCIFVLELVEQQTKTVNKCVSKTQTHHTGAGQLKLRAVNILAPFCEGRQHLRRFLYACN